MEIYVVKPGDSVDSIATCPTAISPESVIYNNQLTYPYALVHRPGAPFIHPFPANLLLFRSYERICLSYINKDVLDETLPFLSSLSVFSYGFLPGGELIPPATDDTFMITAARSFDTSPFSP